MSLCLVANGEYLELKLLSLTNEALPIFAVPSMKV